MPVSCVSRWRFGFLCLPALAGLLGLPAVAADEPTLTFVKPRHLATSLGPTTIQLFAHVPDGKVIQQIEILIDGRRLTTLKRPPWTVEWEAGDGSKGHTLTAVLRLADGAEKRSIIRTSPLRVNQYEAVDLVNLYLVVRTPGGQYVTDLVETDFHILENGKPQRIDRFTASHKPLRVGIVLDTSLSMNKGERLVRAKKAALEFLDVLEQTDEGTVVSFNDTVRVTQELTSEVELLARAIEEPHARGGTALYDAVWRTARQLEGFDGRRVMVLLSDGKDEASNGFEPGSLHTLEEALEQALRSEVMIFPIGLGKNLEKDYVRRWDDLTGLSTLDSSTSLASVLRSLAESTGGRAVISPNAGQLRKGFQQIAADLRHHYSIAYVSDDPERNGQWRSIDVETPGHALEVTTRKGYYARKPKDLKRIRGAR